MRSFHSISILKRGFSGLFASCSRTQSDFTSDVKQLEGSLARWVSNATEQRVSRSHCAPFGAVLSSAPKVTENTKHGEGSPGSQERNPEKETVTRKAAHSTTALSPLVNGQAKITGEEWTER